MTQVLLKKVTHLGERYAHYYRSDKGVLTEVPCSQEEFEAHLKGEPAPQIKGMTWESSSGGMIVVDTPDGKIHEGEFTVLPNGEVFAFLTGHDRPIRKGIADVVGDKVNVTAADQAKFMKR